MMGEIKTYKLIWLVEKINQIYMWKITIFFICLRFVLLKNLIRNTRTRDHTKQKQKRTNQRINFSDFQEE